MRSAVLLALTLSTASLAAADANTAPIQTGTGHEFARTDYSGSKVFLVNKDGKATWEYAAKHCNDLWVLPNGNLLFNTGHGVQEVTREKKVVFQHDSQRGKYEPPAPGSLIERTFAG